MDQRALFDLVVQAQGTLPNFRENQRAIVALNQIREGLSLVEEPFVYDVDFIGANTIAPGATVTLNINIQKDADFKILAGTYVADIAGAAQLDSTRVIPLVTVLLTDTGAGRAFMDRPIPVPSLFGDGRLPFPWPMPKIMRALSTLQVQVTSFVAAGTTYSLRLSFIGVKLYSVGS